MTISEAKDTYIFLKERNRLLQRLGYPHGSDFSPSTLKYRKQKENVFRILIENDFLPLIFYTKANHNMKYEVLSHALFSDDPGIRPNRNK